MFGVQQRLTQPDSNNIDINLQGQSVEKTQAFKYMDVVLDNTIFYYHILSVKKKVSRILGILTRG